jgi:hypothetical protein
MQSYNDYLIEKANDLDFSGWTERSPLEKITKELAGLTQPQQKELVKKVEILFTSKNLWVASNTGLQSFIDFAKDPSAYVNIKAKSKSCSFNTYINGKRRKIAGTWLWDTFSSIDDFLKNPNQRKAVALGIAFFALIKPNKVFVTNEVRKSQNLENITLKNLKRFIFEAVERNDSNPVNLKIGNKVYKNIASVIGDLPTKSKADFLFVDENNQTVAAVSMKDTSAIGYQFDVSRSKVVQGWLANTPSYEDFLNEFSLRIAKYYKKKRLDIPDTISFFDIKKDIAFAKRVTGQNERLNFIYGDPSNINRANVLVKGKSGTETITVDADGTLTLQIEDGFYLNYPSTKVAAKDELFYCTVSETGFEMNLRIANKDVTITRVFVSVRTYESALKAKLEIL